jgi:diacylglycerol kinase (ATP)
VSAAPRTVLLVNVRARVAAELYERAREELIRAGVVLHHAEAVDDPALLAARVHAAVADGATRVVVGGGDGSLSTAAGVLAGGPVALGILPLGTANDFARGLRIPRAELRAAARIVAAGAARAVDVGRIGERVFLNAASVGVSSGLIRRLDGGLKPAAGPLAYPAAGAAEAAQLRPFRARITFGGGGGEGATRVVDALQIVVENGRFHGGGRLVAPGARVDDRRLHAYVLAAASDAAGEPGPADRAKDVARLARFALLLARGRHLEHPALFHARVSRVTVETEPRLELDADGELCAETPAELSSWPGALSVLAPPAA